MRANLASALRKQAGRYSDTIGGGVSGGVSGNLTAAVTGNPELAQLVAGGPQLVGSLAGVLSEPKSPEEIKSMEGAGMSFIPGVGGYRAESVKKAVKGDYEKRNPGKHSSYWSEMFGPMGNAAILGAGGAGLGALAALIAYNYRN